VFPHTDVLPWIEIRSGTGSDHKGPQGSVLNGPVGPQWPQRRDDSVRSFAVASLPRSNSCRYQEPVEVTSAGGFPRGFPALPAAPEPLVLCDTWIMDSLGVMYMFRGRLFGGFRSSNHVLQKSHAKKGASVQSHGRDEAVRAGPMEPNGVQRP